MNALLTVIEHTGAGWATDRFAKTLAHIEALYSVDRWGSRFWISGGDRKVTVEPNLARVEHYHHPRRLMSGILALDRMVARGGKTAPLPRKMRDAAP